MATSRTHSGMGSSALAGVVITNHAWERMCGRRLSPSDLELVLEFGRECPGKKCITYAVGRNEVARHRARGLDLSALEGVQVVTVESGGALVVITVYRNSDFRALRRPGVPGWMVRGAR